jgi:hypothetical protein
MINLIYNSGILTFENANYSIIGYQNIGNEGIHLFISNETNSMVIYLSVETTTVNDDTFETLTELLTALGNPVEIPIETL